MTNSMYIVAMLVLLPLQYSIETTALDMEKRGATEYHFLDSAPLFQHQHAAKMSYVCSPRKKENRSKTLRSEAEIT